MPLPGKINERVIKDFRRTPGLLQVYCKDIFQHLRHQDEAPSRFVAFVEDPAAKMWVDSYFKEHITQSTFLEEAFLSAFDHLISGEVRSFYAIALGELLAGAIKQGSDPAAQYAERFFQRSRVLVGESQASLCGHFVAGLNPELRGLCCLDRDNHEWQSLHALVQYTYAEEVRLQMKRAATNSVSPAPPAKPYKGWTHVGNPDKRRKLDNGSVAFASAQPMDTEDGVVAAVPAPAGRPVDLTTPVEQCPLFGHVSNKLNPLSREQRAVLDTWGGCYHCKKERRLAVNCSLKEKGRDQGKAKGRK
jgi:hypothetical protein